MRHAFAIRLLCLFGLVLFALDVHAAERILDYHADITLAADGGMNVTETIRVHAEGDQIRHGIYRDFPTDYRDREHHRYRVGFTMLAATRDGQPEAWHTERRSNGVRVYLGDADTLVAPGEHTYTIRYRTNRQIGFFADHDELFWNVNGPGWIFPIDHISATVHLPDAIPSARLKAYGYTGTQGSREQALTASVHDGGADFIATRALGSHENLSIVLEFPAGVVTPPSPAQRARWWLADNWNLLLAALGLAVLWIYYIAVWRRRGRDPAAGPLVAEYEPPDGDSAAALRYVQRMGYDDICFTAGILGIAAKGGLHIREGARKTFTASRRDAGDAAAYSADEQALRDALFAAGDELVFKQDEHVRVQAARTAHQQALKAAFFRKYFLTNSGWMLPGFAITLASVWLAGLGGGKDTGFLVVWVGVWSGAVAWLFESARRAGAKALGAWLLFLMFAAGELVGIAGLAQAAGYAIVPLLVALVVTNMLFYAWMKAPTQLGAKLLDRIRGFRWYLGVAEKQELDSRYRPESRPDLFATYLPYALALGVGNAWAHRFTSALTPAQMEQARPAWYSGTTGGFDSANFGSFANSMSSSFSSAIASASVAPGSSSGSSGGSGGGGGGGGGGGW